MAGKPGLILGTAQDTNLYRFAANELRTDDYLEVALELYARYGGGAQVAIGSTAGGSAGITFGTSLDTNLYRPSADLLKTDDSLEVVGNLTAPNIATRIGEAVLGSAAAGIAFSGIPATYRNLMLVIQTRSTASVVGTDLRMFFNSDATANYTSQFFTVYGLNTQAADGPATTTSGYVATVPGASGLANFRAAVVINIPDYRNTSYRKSAVSHFHGEVTSAIYQALGLGGMWWGGTAAINRIDLFLNSGNLDVGTTASLYGYP